MFNVDIRLVVVCMLISMIVGYKLNDLSSIKAGEILYVSQEEILGFEQERLEGVKDISEKKLFCGYPEEAATLIEREVEKSRKEGRMVLFSQGEIYGEKVRSISDEVYNSVISELEDKEIREGKKDREDRNNKKEKEEKVERKEIYESSVQDEAGEKDEVQAIEESGEVQ